jgi:plasmid stabilization system protein ParE
VRYHVEITEPAEKNIREAYEWLRSQSQQAAAIWLDGLLEAVESLAAFPRRCGVAPESEDHEDEIRQLLYGRYRVLFLIRERKVFILHVRHAARYRASEEDLYPE